MRLAVSLLAERRQPSLPVLLVACGLGLLELSVAAEFDAANKRQSALSARPHVSFR